MLYLVAPKPEPVPVTKEDPPDKSENLENVTGNIVILSFHHYDYRVGSKQHKKIPKF